MNMNSDATKIGLILALQETLKMRLFSVFQTTVEKLKVTDA